MGSGEGWGEGRGGAEKGALGIETHFQFKWSSEALELSIMAVGGIFPLADVSHGDEP